MLAAALLAVAAAEHRTTPAPPGLIPLTRNEIAALFSSLIIKPPGGTRYRLRWSAWRRRHQYRARKRHCQRQAAHNP
jgi:hypothetical protein